MNNEKPFPNFAAWSHENLTAFAKESYSRIFEQDKTIDSLREDLREAMEQCRVLLRKQDART
jgi:hypothetical protein